VVDDSTDLTPRWLKEWGKTHKNITVLRPEEEIKTAWQAYMLCLPITKTPYIVIMGNSTLVEPHWLDAGFGLMKHPDVGMVGFKCLTMTGVIECTYIQGLFADGVMSVPDMNELSHQATYVCQVPAVAGALVLYRKEAIGTIWEELDKRYYGFRGFEDLDACLSMRQNGWNVVYCGYGCCKHVAGSTKMENSPEFWNEFNENKRIFRERWPNFTA